MTIIASLVRDATSLDEQRFIAYDLLLARRPALCVEYAQYAWETDGRTRPLLQESTVASAF